QAPDRAPVVTRSERAPWFDRDHGPTIRSGPVPRWGDQEPPPDRPRGEMGSPGVRPVLIGERDDAQPSGGLEPKLAQPVQVLPDARFERARENRPREERAELRASSRPLLLDHAERTELPREIGQSLGEVGGRAHGELPEAGG